MGNCLILKSMLNCNIIILYESENAQCSLLAFSWCLFISPCLSLVSQSDAVLYRDTEQSVVRHSKCTYSASNFRSNGVEMVDVYAFHHIYFGDIPH